MTITRFVPMVAAAAALALAPLRGHAQSAGPFIGIGVGAGRVAEPEANAARLAPSAHARAGWQLTPNVALMVEGTLNGIGSPNPDAPPFDPGIGGTYRNRQLQTGTLLASVQLGGGSFYVRPGIGVARHAFTVFRPMPEDGYSSETSHEMGPAAGIAIGHMVNAIPGFPVNVEAVGFWSGGEDSSGHRWSAGVQLTRDFHF
ncbi:MAG TPA: hypothetical protein VFJ16_19980 [Longimicrobium sp.]|nr:hypothetical protein [Longimicrobium sp.]